MMRIKELMRIFFGGIYMNPIPMRKVSDFYEPYVNEEEFFRRLQSLTFTGAPTQIDYQLFKENIQRKVWPMLSQTHFYLIDESYTETEWKDMISEHYIHTRYLVKPTAVRVHLFNEKSEINQSYLGCFTLRKINNNDMVLSFIYPNWNVLCLEECNFKNSYLVTVQKTIHILAEEVQITTTPFFVQDGAVTCCAHANILMMSHFLHLRFGYKKIRIPEIAQGYLRREKQYPTKGLIPEQIMEVLTNNGVYIRPIIVKKENLPLEKKEDIKETIKAHLRSGLPVLMLIDKHAVLIVGFREEENFDGVVFFDDSGVLIHSINEKIYEEQNNEYDNFVYNCSWNYIFNFVKEKSAENIYFLVPFHEKIFVNYDDVFCRCLILEKNMMEDGETYALTNKRFFIADNVVCKKFINEYVMDRELVGDAVDQFIRNEQPHYLWCYEFEFQGELYIIFINSTYNMHDKENNMYINKNCEPFHIAKHFHTVEPICLWKMKQDQIPLFTKRLNQCNSFGNHDVFDNVNVMSKAPTKPSKRLEEPLEKTRDLNDAPDENKIGKEESVNE